MTSTQQATGTYRIVPGGSTAEFSVRAMFGAARVRGRFAIRGGSVVVEQDSARVHAVLDTASIDTGNARRDKDLRSARFLDVTPYPALSFAGVGAPSAGSTVTGQLTACGETAPITLTIEGIDGHTVRASARVDRLAFLRGKRPIIGRYVDVSLSIALTP